MKERPILFNGQMVRALLDGSKTQTRRVVKPQPTDARIAGACRYDEYGQWVWLNGYDGSIVSRLGLCPYGQPGDRLWVRESFSGPHCMEATDECAAAPPSKWGESSRIWYWADGEPTHGDWTRPRPSIHMPRWASRITLEIISVRVERLQDISEANALAEGVDMDQKVTMPMFPGAPCAVTIKPRSAIEAYAVLWESINGPSSWHANPWVWVIEFQRLPT